MEQYLTKLINNISNAQKAMPQIFARVIARYPEEVIDLNVGQLRKGITNTGKLITPALRSDAYAKYKKFRGGEAPPGTPDMINEGDFTGDFYIEQRGDNILIDSHDDKTPQLDADYEGIFGLTRESKNQLIDDNTQEIIKEIENEIFT